MGRIGGGDPPDATRLRSSEFRAAPAVQFIDPIRVTASSMTTALAWAIRTPRSIETDTPARAKGSIPLLRSPRESGFWKKPLAARILGRLVKMITGKAIACWLVYN